MVKRTFTLEYWLDDGWYVGRLKEVPGVFSQGATLEELEDNLQEAYRLMLEEGAFQDHPPDATKEVVLDVA
ncbi:MAG TPA: type II toxin-antitoxin system HicB family antitoxin [Methylothermaceae bacterium]|nr:type II toxin-antitoxin system HicB family antitoxin [Methylothermaceae bacterium]